MSAKAPIIEIFASYQGEGPRVGERHLFVRFQDCELACKFCDTPLSFVDNKFCRIEFPPFSKKLRQLPNPLSVEELNVLLSDFDEEILVLTGGEPLQKSSFLREWLPTLAGRRKILLETAGTHFSELREVIEWIDILSMDLKLPSSTGMHPWWREHQAFLKAAKEKPGLEIYIKVVVTAETEEKDMHRAIDMISSLDPTIPFIIQPATAFGRFRSVPSIEQVALWQQEVGRRLKEVRVIPQVHKALGVS